LTIKGGDVTELIRWNASFVRGLAQSVLDRAKVIRLGLEQKKVAKKVAKKAGKKARKTKRVKKTNA
jgi:hypothetical protein